MKGFTDDQVKELLARGWLKGIDCGYKNHEGFIHDYREPSPRGHYSLTPAKRGQFLLANIVQDVCDTKQYLWFTQVLEYFKM